MEVQKSLVDLNLKYGFQNKLHKAKNSKLILKVLAI